MENFEWKAFQSNFVRSKQSSFSDIIELTLAELKYFIF